MTVKQISATELKNKLEQNEKLFLLDVREPHEFQFAHIPNSILIPLNQLEHRLHEVDPQQEIIVICHHGMRSHQAAHLLLNLGYKNITNLTDGIDAWSLNCDSSVHRY
ncbi:MAG: rhodanese-like domain-containing protein [Methylococcales bacterium]|nr:rhodanese-like domain-containing protein [Methylococcales bacterium]